MAENAGKSPSDGLPESIYLQKPKPSIGEIRLTEEEAKGLVLVRKKCKPPNPCPYVKFYDPNNEREQDKYDCNPQQRAVVIGLKWSF